MHDDGAALLLIAAVYAGAAMLYYLIPWDALINWIVLTRYMQ